MGLFSKKKVDNNDEQNENNERVGSTKERAGDMVSLIKLEQQRNSLINPFVVATPTVAQKSIAKQYGTKYIGAPGLQLASSIVVDVRSYNKSDETIDDSADDEDLEDEVSSDDETSLSGSSFFDEIMKSLDEAENFDFDKPTKPTEEVSKPVVAQKKEEAPKKPKKTSSSTKRKIDIDIISGDFGGSDII